MANDTVITVVGNLTGDPELRFTASGVAVASFTIASTPRSFDKQSKEWKDGEALFMRCSLWREAAENVAESLTKGMRVIAQGNLVQRSYETREGEKRTVIELQVEDIGPSLKYSSAKVTRNARSGSGGQQQSSSGFAQAPGQSAGSSTFQNAQNPAQGDDPWATSAPAQGGGFADEMPPF